MIILMIHLSILFAHENMEGIFLFFFQIWYAGAVRWSFD